MHLHFTSVTALPAWLNVTESMNDFMSRRPRPLGRSRSSGSIGRWARRGIKAGALVVDHEARQIRAMGDQEAGCGDPDRGLGGPSSRQLVVSPVVLATHLGADFEIAMDTREFRSYSSRAMVSAHQLGGVPAVKLGHLVLKEFEERGNEVNR